MPPLSGPIYEVALFADQQVVDECDQWLDEHVRSTLRDSRVSDCRLFDVSAAEPGRFGRVCQHVIVDDAALDALLQSTLGTLEADIREKLGPGVEFEARVLRQDENLKPPSASLGSCLNCGARLQGQYCATCGQRANSRLIKLWQLVSEAFGDLFEMDSRLWRTLIPLVVRPGQLTRDYLQGKRARFMPPFRMYLVLSLVFFIVAFFDPREELGLLFEPPEEAASTIDAGSADAGVVPAEADSSKKIAENCDIEVEVWSGMPAILARQLTSERLERICRQVVADQGKSLVAEVVSSVPTALIVLLPLMALVQKALYPLSRRYYVEHLLFFVHLHSFFFLLITLQIVLTRLAEADRLPDLATGLMVAGSWLYMPVYVFVALRRVYGQSRWATFFKFIALVVAYVLGFSTIMAVTFAIAAFSL